MNLRDSVVLLTGLNTGPTDCGSGFVVDRQGDDAIVVTCAHVIRNWGDEVLVDGRRAKRIEPTMPIDLVALSVTGLNAAALSVKGFGRDGTAFHGFSYRHLYRHDYVREPIEGKVTRQLALQGRAQQNGAATVVPGRVVPAFEIKATRGHLKPGNSGSPLIHSRTREVLGVISHAHDDGKSGIAISAEAISLVYEPLNAIGSQMENKPPEPPPVSSQADDDPQKGRFAQTAEPWEHDGRRLEARITRKGRDWVYFDISVVSTDKSPLEGPARFFLHDSYPRERVWVHKPQTKSKLTLGDVYSYGVYSVGVQVMNKDRKWVSLELDLSTLAGIPEEVRRA